MKFITRFTMRQLLLMVSLGISTNVVAETVVEIPPDMTHVEVDSDLVNTINSALPESSNVNEDFLNPEYSPVLPLSEEAHLSVTFIDEGAGYRNSLGWFSWADGVFDNLTKADIDMNDSGIISYDELTAIDGVNANWLFANASMEGKGGSLTTGDTVILNDGNTFAAGTNVSFFLGANTWDGTDIVGETSGTGEKNIFYGLDFLNPEALSSSLYGSDGGNDISRHVAMLFADETQDQVILGFEDLIRPAGDNDFNDAIFIVEADPASAIADANIVTAPLPVAATGLLGWLFIILLGGIAFQRDQIDGDALI
jgi:hypothetical protein